MYITFIQYTADEQEQRHPSSPPYHCASPAAPIQSEHGKEHAEHVGQVIESSQEFCIALAEASALNKIDGYI
jgi:hypothetical protein